MHPVAPGAANSANSDGFAGLPIGSGRGKQWFCVTYVSLDKGTHHNTAPYTVASGNSPALGTDFVSFQTTGFFFLSA